MTALDQLHAAIESRVQIIRQSHPDWLCRQGCDNCCRRLADVPLLRSEEWGLLRAALAKLPAEQFANIARDVAAMANDSSRPIACPMLDAACGACPVYAGRPVACRTFGFYVQRGVGLYCSDIEARVAAGALNEVVWGNHDSIDHSLAGFGELLTLPEWFERWKRDGFRD